MSIKTLKIDERQPVQYCIPLWLRNEQVRINTAKVKGRIEPGAALRPGPIAVVCYGPSLNDTWELVKSFKYIMTCSGAHKFLLGRGVIPTHHVEVDPREHKVQLLGSPHKNVEYIIASTCHPKYFDNLDGYNVRLWHVFADEEDAMRILPPQEWALMGGSSVGLRALTIARFIGFTDLHIFGMDGCEGPTGKHAAAHPMQPRDHSVVEHKGITYRTTPSMLECARQTWHELNQMPDVKATFYGTGLVQAMAVDYHRPTPTGQVTIAYSKPPLISAEFRDLNSRLHTDNLAYGVGGGKHSATVLKLAEGLKTTSILDYGCGKGYLAKGLPFPIWEYDPAVSGKQEHPRPADIVVCTDVLEHVEPDKLNGVLADLARCVKMVGFFVIHTGPAKKHYADGRNTHLIQEGESWWHNRLAMFFSIGKIITVGKCLHIVVAPRNNK